MTDPLPLPDEATRPKAPKIAGATDQHRRQGRRLALFHEMHLRELARVHQAMEGVFAGNGKAEALLTTISAMQMVSNMRRFGNLCGGAWQMLTGHHSIEDQWMFPALEGQSDGLSQVVSRLRAEHLVIHDLIVRLEDASYRLIENPGARQALTLREEFDRLHAFVVSHFGYEQQELEEALGFYGIDI